MPFKRTSRCSRSVRSPSLKMVVRLRHGDRRGKPRRLERHRQAAIGDARPDGRGLPRRRGLMPRHDLLDGEPSRRQRRARRRRSGRPRAARSARSPAPTSAAPARAATPARRSRGISAAHDSRTATRSSDTGSRYTSAAREPACPAQATRSPSVAGTRLSFSSRAASARSANTRRAARVIGRSRRPASAPPATCACRPEPRPASTMVGLASIRRPCRQAEGRHQHVPVAGSTQRGRAPPRHRPAARRRGAAGPGAPARSAVSRERRSKTRVSSARVESRTSRTTVVAVERVDRRCRRRQPVPAGRRDGRHGTLSPPSGPRRRAVPGRPRRGSRCRSGRRQPGDLGGRDDDDDAGGAGRTGGRRREPAGRQRGAGGQNARAAASRTHRMARAHLETDRTTAYNACFVAMDILRRSSRVRLA